MTPTSGSGGQTEGQLGGLEGQAPGMEKSGNKEIKTHISPVCYHRSSTSLGMLPKRTTIKHIRFGPPLGPLILYTSLKAR